MSTLRQAIDEIKAKVVKELLEETHLTLTDLKAKECFKHTSTKGIEIALDELENNEQISQDKKGRYYIISPQ